MGKHINRERQVNRQPQKDTCKQRKRERHVNRLRERDVNIQTERKAHKPTVKKWKRGIYKDRKMAHEWTVTLRKTHVNRQTGR